MSVWGRENMSWSSNQQGGGNRDADSLTAVGAGSAVLFCLWTLLSALWQKGIYIALFLT